MYVQSRLPIYDRVALLMCHALHLMPDIGVFNQETTPLE